MDPKINNNSQDFYAEFWNQSPQKNDLKNNSVFGSLQLPQKRIDERL